MACCGRRRWWRSRRDPRRRRARLRLRARAIHLRPSTWHAAAVRRRGNWIPRSGRVSPQSMQQHRVRGPRSRDRRPRANPVSIPLGVRPSLDAATKISKQAEKLLCRPRLLSIAPIYHQFPKLLICPALSLVDRGGRCTCTTTIASSSLYIYHRPYISSKRSCGSPYAQ
jgi:hypothetical protein